MTTFDKWFKSQFGSLPKKNAMHHAWAKLKDAKYSYDQAKLEYDSALALRNQYNAAWNAWNARK